MLLLQAKDMISDPELREFVTDPQANYWMAPNAHAGILSFLLLSQVLMGHGELRPQE